MQKSRSEVFLEAYRLRNEPGFENLTDLELLKAAETSLLAKERKRNEILEESLKKPEQLSFDFKEN